MHNSQFKLPLEHHAAKRDKAIEWQNKASQRQSDETVKIADEKVQYFEKLAFGVGATLAVIISFVSAHPTGIHTPHLVQWASLLLVVALFAAMARNWFYPFYKGGVWIRHKVQADQQVEDIEAAMCRDYPSVPVLDQDNKPIPPDKFLADYEQNKLQRANAISTVMKREEWFFRTVVALETLSVASIIAAAVLLAIAVWLTVGFHAASSLPKP